MASWWAQDGFDLLLTPTCGEPPPPLGSFEPAQDNPFAAILRSIPFAIVHRGLQHHRSTRDHPAAAPDARRSPGGDPARRRLRPRGSAPPGRGPARAGASVDGPDPAGARRRRRPRLTWLIGECPRDPRGRLEVHGVAGAGHDHHPRSRHRARPSRSPSPGTSRRARRRSASPASPAPRVGPTAGAARPSPAPAAPARVRPGCCAAGRREPPPATSGGCPASTGVARPPPGELLDARAARSPPPAARRRLGAPRARRDRRVPGWRRSGPGRSTASGEASATCSAIRPPIE